MSDKNIMTGLKQKFVEKWAAAGRAGSDNMDDEERVGRPHKISPKSCEVSAAVEARTVQ